MHCGIKDHVRRVYSRRRDRLIVGRPATLWIGPPSWSGTRTTIPRRTNSDHAECSWEFSSMGAPSVFYRLSRETYSWSAWLAGSLRHWQHGQQGLLADSSWLLTLLTSSLTALPPYSSQSVCANSDVKGCYNQLSARARQGMVAWICTSRCSCCLVNWMNYLTNMKDNR